MGRIYGIIPLCERAHELTPREKLRFITMERVQSRLNSLFEVRPCRNLPTPARDDPESWRRMWPHARDLGTPRTSHGTRGHIGGGTAFVAFERGEPHSRRGRGSQARRERAKHAPLAHAWAPYSMDTQKIHLHPPPPPLWQDGDRRQTSPRSKC